MTASLKDFSASGSELNPPEIMEAHPGGRAV
jgi:hypothetical protein